LTLQDQCLELHFCFGLVANNNYQKVPLQIPSKLLSIC
jgi:hypothetical protein